MSLRTQQDSSVRGPQLTGRQRSRERAHLACGHLHLPIEWGLRRPEFLRSIEPLHAAVTLHADPPGGKNPGTASIRTRTLPAGRTQTKRIRQRKTQSLENCASPQKDTGVAPCLCSVAQSIGDSATHHCMTGPTPPIGASQRRSFSQRGLEELRRHHLEVCAYTGASDAVRGEEPLSRTEFRGTHRSVWSIRQRKALCVNPGGQTQTALLLGVAAVADKERLQGAFEARERTLRPKLSQQVETSRVSQRICL